MEDESEFDIERRLDDKNYHHCVFISDAENPKDTRCKFCDKKLKKRGYASLDSGNWEYACQSCYVKRRKDV